MKVPRRHSSSPTIAVLQMYGVEPTLDTWLDFNGVSDVYDAELLEVIPEGFRDEYNNRLHLNAHYERKCAEQAAMKRAGGAQTGSQRCASMEGVSKPGAGAAVQPTWNPREIE